MLETIDEIDWERLTHACGPASDVPEQIKALRSADKEIREKTAWTLYGNIFHQGTRYQARLMLFLFCMNYLLRKKSKTAKPCCFY